MIKLNWSLIGVSRKEYYLVKRLSIAELGMYRYALVTDKARMSLALATVDMLFDGNCRLYPTEVGDTKYISDFHRGYTASIKSVTIEILHERFRIIQIDLDSCRHIDIPMERLLQRKCLLNKD